MVTVKDGWGWSMSSDKCKHGLKPGSCSYCLQQGSRTARIQRARTKFSKVHSEILAQSSQQAHRKESVGDSWRPGDSNATKTSDRCGRCGKKWLLTHLEGHEAKCRNKVPCPQCGKRFYFSSLNKHLARCEGGKSCRYCKQLVPKSTMKEHLRTCRAANQNEEYLDLMDTGLVYGYPRGSWSRDRG
jgi:hypothetical protein